MTNVKPSLPAWLLRNRQAAEIARFNNDPANRRRGKPVWLVKEIVARRENR